ncbi:hypothetical protein [Nocardia terrae]|uniref:hypothetical protein n=1 Tax=Nocardia terrae TaxID=2675851 RepID=UPI0018DF6416|nr:hypothetical protein [Nocardia terrae]
MQDQPAPGSCAYRFAAGGDYLPDPNCTPGATNPDVSQATLDSTICRSGYAGTIRPPASVTRREKQANARSYGYTDSLATAEYDHLISLELGGDPNDPRNLWVEPGSSPNAKDSVENQLKSMVCSRQVALADAQEAIATDWTTALDRVGTSPAAHPPA